MFFSAMSFSEEIALKNHAIFTFGELTGLYTKQLRIYSRSALQKNFSIIICASPATLTNIKEVVVSHNTYSSRDVRNRVYQLKMIFVIPVIRDGFPVNASK